MIGPKQLKSMSDEERQSFRLDKIMEYIEEVMFIFYQKKKGVDIPLGAHPDEWGFSLFDQVIKKCESAGWFVRPHTNKDLSFGVILSDPDDGFISPTEVIYVENISRQEDPLKLFQDPLQSRLEDLYKSDHEDFG